MSLTPFETIAFILAEIRRLAEEGDWVSAGEAFNQLHAQIESGTIPKATAADLAALQRAKEHLDSLAERAISLHTDMATLLKAFGGTDKPGV